MKFKDRQFLPRYDQELIQLVEKLNGRRMRRMDVTYALKRNTPIVKGNLLERIIRGEWAMCDLTRGIKYKQRDGKYIAQLKQHGYSYEWNIMPVGEIT